MDLNNQKTKMLISNIGKLFYAVAACDKTINEKEADTLRTIIQREWNTPELQTLFMHYDVRAEIVAAYEREASAHTLPAQCFKDFEQFAIANNSLFTHALQKKIMATAYAIAESYAGKNKSELFILIELEILFKNIAT